MWGRKKKKVRWQKTQRCHNVGQSDKWLNYKQLEQALPAWHGAGLAGATAVKWLTARMRSGSRHGGPEGKIQWPTVAEGAACRCSYPVWGDSSRWRSWRPNQDVCARQNSADAIGTAPDRHRSLRQHEASVTALGGGAPLEASARR